MVASPIDRETKLTCFILTSALQVCLVLVNFQLVLM